MRPLTALVALCLLLALGAASCFHQAGSLDVGDARTSPASVADAALAAMSTEERLVYYQGRLAQARAELVAEREARLQSWITWLSVLAGLGAVACLALGIWLSALRRPLILAAGACAAVLALLQLAARLVPWLPWLGAAVLAAVAAWLYWYFLRADPKQLKKPKKEISHG